MASSVTKYTIYETGQGEDAGKVLTFMGEFEAYTRKDAIGKLVKQDAERTDRPEDETPLADRIKAEDESERPAFIVAPSSGFMVVVPKVETKVEVTF